MLPSNYSITQFRKGIRKWLKNNELRDFPWRKSNDNFQLFVTEILLRRTHAEAVATIWNAFFNKYASFKDIKNATVNELYSDLLPLGLAKIRTKNLLEIGELISTIPKDEKKLLTLPGVGKYIARAYLLMKYNKYGLIYDTNFRTIYSRYFGIDISKDLKRDKVIEPLSKLVIPKRNTRVFILAILDISALICKPQIPLCDKCTLRPSCKYYKNNRNNN